MIPASRVVPAILIGTISRKVLLTRTVISRLRQNHALGSEKAEQLQKRQPKDREIISFDTVK
jgi:hypothetical protein